MSHQDYSPLVNNSASDNSNLPLNDYIEGIEFIEHTQVANDYDDDTYDCQMMVTQFEFPLPKMLPMKRHRLTNEPRPFVQNKSPKLESVYQLYEPEDYTVL